MYRIRPVSSSEEFALLEHKWNSLLSNSSSNNIFLRWEWLWNWWDVFRTEDMLLIVLLIENEKNELTGIAPFYSIKKSLGGIYPLKRLMFLGTQMDGEGGVGSEYMDIICKKGEEEGIAESIFDYIAQHDYCDEIYLSATDTSGIAFNHFKKLADKNRCFSVIFNESRSPYISLPSVWEEYLNGLSSSMRYRIRKERRNLEKTSKVEIRKTTVENELDSDFQEFVRLHQARWVSRSMAGAFSSKKFEMFHKRLVTSLIKSGFLDLIFLSIDGRNKAAMYNIAYNNKIYFYLSGLDLSGTKGALGLVLHSHCIEDAICKGMKEYDFMLKGKLDSYKDQWTKDSRAVTDLCIVRPGVAKHYMRARELARSCYHSFIVRDAAKI